MFRSLARAGASLRTAVTRSHMSRGYSSVAVAHTAKASSVGSRQSSHIAGVGVSLRINASVMSMAMTRNTSLNVSSTTSCSRLSHTTCGAPAYYVDTAASSIAIPLSSSGVVAGADASSTGEELGAPPKKRRGLPPTNTRYSDR